jgi:hypothetical protein
MIESRSDHDLDTEAEEALEAARAMLPGKAKSEAMKGAGLLRKARCAGDFIRQTRQTAEVGSRDREHADTRAVATGFP